MTTERLIPWYYAASALFLLLDFGADINVRVAFLEPWPAARGAYYGVCFACLALMMWRPDWAVLIATFESLVTLVALILSMGLRVMIPNVAIFGETASVVTVQEIMNFLIAGFVAYRAWFTGLRALRMR